MTGLLGHISAKIARRFATKSSRFALAVSTGFIVAVVGVASTSLDRAGFADGLADLFGSGFSGSSLFGAPQQGTQPQYGVQGGQAAFWDPSHHRHAGRRRVDVARDDDGPHMMKVRTRHADGEVSDRSEPIGGRSMCVRLCDGYAFPVGAYHGEGDRAAHEATCHSECPGAQTALYIMPAGSDSIADAVRVGTGRNYSALPDAFHYSTVLDEACTCHPASGNRIQSLLHDFTLRRGDAVMTRTGLKVFHGGGQFPYRRNDFVALNSSRDIRGTDRATYRAIERASLFTPPKAKVATKPVFGPPVADRRDGTKTLEHQASLVDAVRAPTAP